MDTSAKIANLPLPGYAFNASGPLCTTLDELQNIHASKSGATMMKSCTLEPREGNPKPRYKETPFGSINSMGLPNLGYQKYREFAKELKQQNPEKPIFASVAGLWPDDFPHLVSAFQQSDVDYIEANFSCPNVPGKPQIAYDFDAVDNILSRIENLGDKPLGIKLPPFYDLVHFEHIAGIIQKYNLAFVTCINSVGNTLIIDPKTEKPLIHPKGGFGGLGGQYIKPIALANTRKFYELFGDKLDVIGCGGIETGTDAFEYLLAGASGVQIATEYAKQGTACFNRIQNELADILTKKGYQSVEDAKGKLEPLDAM